MSPPPGLAPVPVIDRLSARCGAAHLVHRRPGMGWMLVEVVLPTIWCQLTGALGQDTYYLVCYLLALGASPAQMGWLPLVLSGGVLAHACIALRRPPGGDARRTCIRDTAIARALWLGTVAWPLIAWWRQWSPGTILMGILLTILVSQALHYAGIAAFMTWTRALVPRRHRGSFYLVRSLLSFAALEAVLLIMARVVPARPSAVWLMGLMAAATGLVLLGTLALAWVPPGEAAVPVAPRQRTAWHGRSAFLRWCGWGAIQTAATGCVIAYLPVRLQAIGIGGGSYAAYQGLWQLPMMILGFLLAARLVRRHGPARVMLLTQAVAVLADASALLLAPGHLLLCGPVFALGGLSRAMLAIAWPARLQELIPADDARYPSLYLAATGLGGVLAAVAMLALAAGTAAPSIPALAGGPPAGLVASRAADSAWWAVAAGASFRLLGLALLVAPRARPPGLPPGRGPLPHAAA
jgi:hypothetical protein